MLNIAQIIPGSSDWRQVNLFDLKLVDHHQENKISLNYALDSFV
jgi:hypothetical protein